MGGMMGDWGGDALPEGLRPFRYCWLREESWGSLLATIGRSN